MVRYGGIGSDNLMFMRLGDIVETYGHGFHTLSEKIAYARKYIFDFDYPTLDPAHKEVLETMILRHFFFNEIGFETEGRFLFELESWLNLHMPYWNKLIESQKWEKEINNPFHNYELTDTNISEMLTDVNEDSSLDVIRNNQDNTVVTGGSTVKSNEDGSERTLQTGTENTVSSIETDSEATDTTNQTQEEGAFNRKLESDTPQNRLTITANDGQGLIEYASKIDEDKGQAESSLESVNQSQGNQTQNGTNDVSKNDETLANNEKEINTVSTDNSNQNTTGSSNGKETGVKKTESVQHNREERTAVGSIGVARYDELLNGYRTIFKNYEHHLLNAMHTDLFMLVY